MRERRGLKSYLLSSFFGAAMIAAAYAYFNYKFSQFHFIDFDKSIFYTSNDLFVPKEERYTLIVYSSKKDTVTPLLKRIPEHEPFLALDISGERFESSGGVLHITATINTLLPLINRFKIMEVPVVFDIERVGKNNFKQCSKIETFN